MFFKTLIPFILLSSSFVYSAGATNNQTNNNTPKSAVAPTAVKQASNNPPKSSAAPKPLSTKAAVKEMAAPSKTRAALSGESTQKAIGKLKFISVLSSLIEIQGNRQNQ